MRSRISVSLASVHVRWIHAVSVLYFNQGFTMTEGWIKIHRKIIDWQWFSDPNMVQVFLYLICLANTEDIQYKGITLHSGQIAISVATICERLKLSPRQVRTCLNRLKTTNELTIESTNQFSIITICNFDSYQVEEINKRQTKRQTTRHPNDKQTKEKERVSPDISSSPDPIISFNPLKKEKEREECCDCSSQSTQQHTEIEELETKQSKWSYPIPPAELNNSAVGRFNRFYDSLVPYVGQYGKEMVRDFFYYWTEPTRDGKKMKFETQNTWAVSKRLATWSKKEQQNGNNSWNGNCQRAVSRRDQRIADERAAIADVARVIEERSRSSYDGSL